MAKFHFSLISAGKNQLILESYLNVLLKYELSSKNYSHELTEFEASWADMKASIEWLNHKTKRKHDENIQKFSLRAHEIRRFIANKLVDQQM